MPVSEAEQTAINVMKEAQTKAKLSAFDMLKYLVRGDMNLDNCGYKSIEDATQKIMARAFKEIAAAEKIFLKQFPDC